MPKLRNSSKGDSNPGSLDCESGILPLSYRDNIILLPYTYKQDMQRNLMRIRATETVVIVTYNNSIISVQVSIQYLKVRFI